VPRILQVSVRVRHSEWVPAATREIFKSGGCPSISRSTILLCMPPNRMNSPSRSISEERRWRNSLPLMEILHDGSSASSMRNSSVFTRGQPRDSRLRLGLLQAYRRISSSIHNMSSPSDVGRCLGPGLAGASRRPTIASTFLTKASSPQGRPV